jgi:2-dehydropantoate 2-reductase
MRETVAVARACGVGMCEADVASALHTLQTLPPGCTPSMQRDLTHGRPSELEDQAGAVVRIAALRGVAVPVLGALHSLLRPQERAARGEVQPPGMAEDEDAAA